MRTCLRGQALEPNQVGLYDLRVLLIVHDEIDLHKSDNRNYKLDELTRQGHETTKTANN